MGIGQRLRYFRQERGYSVKELSEKCSVSERMIYGYERDERIPPIKVLEKMCEVLKADSKIILGW